SCSVVFDHFSTLNLIVSELLSKGIDSFVFLCEGLSNYRACKLYGTFMKIMFQHKIESYEIKMINSKDPYDTAKELSVLPGAVLCSKDEIAAGVIKAFKDEGIKIPQQVSIIGYGNFSCGNLLGPSLSSVEYMNEETGRICGQYILKMINGEEVPKKIVLGTRLVKRESSL
ncbi:MAG TPA: LacI family DNA-binding transcriptional regulator, partial [Pseudothermotoga sp.]